VQVYCFESGGFNVIIGPGENDFVSFEKSDAEQVGYFMEYVERRE
jgi:hypothetical protein